MGYTTLPTQERLGIPHTASSYETLGTDGTGFVGLKTQTTTPSTPASGVRQFVDSSGNLTGVDSTGATANTKAKVATVDSVVASTVTTDDLVVNGTATIAGFADVVARNSRAPRQGLAFNGTAGASGTLQSSLGASDWTIHAIVRFANTASSREAIVGGPANGIALLRTAVGGLRLEKAGVAGALDTSGVTLAANKTYAVTVTCTSQVYKAYVDAIVAADGGSTAQTFSDPTIYIGNNFDAVTERMSGFVSVWVFNRALSASEIAALFESGAPAASDYPSGGAGVEHSSITVDTGSPTVTDKSTFAFTAGTMQVVVSNPLAWATYGNRYRITGSASGVTGTITVAFPGYTIGNITSNGAFRFEGQFSANPASVILNIYNNTTGAASITNFSVIPPGLLLAPEANASGVGPQLRDVSGKLAHINLPGDGIDGGVTWALPGGASGDFGETRTASGYALGRDAVVIPSGYRIARIWCSGNGSFSIGNAASGTEVVNAFTATSTTQPATLAAYTTSSRKLYITLGTASTVTYSVHLERI